MNAKECYEAGKLTEAIEAINSEVKAAPSDIAKRNFLCELLCFAGEFERADKNLETIGKLDAKAMVPSLEFRQQIRGEQARQQVFREGRVPEFLGLPSPTLKLHLEATIALREGKTSEAVELLAQAEEVRPKTKGTINGEAFEDFRDLDDTIAPFLEVITSTGKYYWVPMERVQSLEFEAPKSPRDLIWRRASVSVIEGPEGEVFVPCLYVGTQDDADPKAKLGRVTDWKGGDGSPVRGIGLRTFLAGERDLTILQVNEFALEEPATESAPAT